MAVDAGDIWVFAYGSLMWRPGFEYLESAPALLRGYHRSFCIYSFHYRGTEARPGLVLGLDRGGSCRGLAFRVAAARAGAVLAYLDERELVTSVYRRRRLPVALPGMTVPAITYVADRHHRQYAGKLAPADAAAIIRHSAGRTGPNLDYLASTVRHLQEMGIRDDPLHRLLSLVEAPG